MKAPRYRIYEIEYLNKIEALVKAGVGRSFSEVCKKACFEGVDEMYERIINKATKIEIQDRLDEISKKLTEYARQVYREERENLLVGYINRQIISSVHNILLNFIEFGYIDVENAENGMFDAVPERFMEQFENMEKDIK